MIKKKIPLKGWIMWLLASLFYAYQYILRVLPNIMMEDIMSKFHIDASIFGQFSGFYYVGYAGAHIPIGILLDRLGPKSILPICVVLTVLGLAPLIYTDLWIFPSIGRALIGIGSSGAILGVFKIIRLVFPETRFTRMLGIAVTIGLLGAIYGGEPVNYLLGVFGWEIALHGIGLIGIVLALFLYFLTPALKGKKGFKGNVWHDVKEVLSNKMVLVICILGGFMVGPLEGFADVWGTEYLKLAYELPDTIASSLPSFIFLGMCFGAPFLSYAADRWHAYYGVITLSAFVMAFGFLLIFFGHLSVTFWGIIFFIIGIFCAYQIPVIYKASSYVSEKAMGLTTACANMIIMIFGYIFHGSIGRLMDVFWQGNMAHGMRVYLPSSYMKALLIIPIGLILGGIGFWYLKHKTKEG